MGELCPLVHDCGGATGRHVRIFFKAKPVPPLPGNRTSSSSSSPGTALVCYGVEARSAMALPVPVMEYTTSTDPEDPIFYSTCFIREEDWIWEPSPKKAAASPTKGGEDTAVVPMWAFGRKCLDCGTYATFQRQVSGVNVAPYPVH